MGCDAPGRDLRSRIICGARVSMLIGLLVLVPAATVGVPGGLLRGWVDVVIFPLADILPGFSDLIFAIGWMAAPGPGFGNMLIALAHKERVLPCRVLRTETSGAREQDDAGAARALGALRRPIMLREIRPDILSPVILVATFRIACAIILEASLSFPGLGVQPPTPRGGR